MKFILFIYFFYPRGTNIVVHYGHFFFFLYIIQVFFSYFPTIVHYQMILYFFAPCIYILFLYSQLMFVFFFVFLGVEG